jgi:hypothetical protein
MPDFLVILVHLIVTVVRLAKPGGFRSVVAESVLVRHQLLILNRGRKRAPNLRARDRIFASLCTLFIPRARLLPSAIVRNVVFLVAGDLKHVVSKILSAPALQLWPELCQRTKSCAPTDKDRNVLFQGVWVVSGGSHVVYLTPVLL